MKHIYLDYNATTPIAPSVQEAMLPFLAEHYGNPSSGHALGRACHEALEDARSQVAAMLGADADEIVFTGGGTEANNLAIKGVMMQDLPSVDGHLIVSSFEHPAVAEPAKFLERIGFGVTVVPCDRRGVVSADAIADAMRPDTRLVSIMHANNEIGTVQPIREIARVCRRSGVLLHTDAAQSVGKIPVGVNDLDVDLLTIAGHKLYAPKGVGALYVRHGVALAPALHGAAHEGGLRPGTENVAYIVALGRAATLVSKSLDDSQPRLTMLRDRLYDLLHDTIGDRLTINGAEARRLPNTLSVNFPGAIGAEILSRIPELCASTGSACHSGTTNMSASLKALDLDPATAAGTVRLSVGWHTSEEDIDLAASWLIRAWEDSR